MIFGIVSSESILKLSWEINNLLHISLSQSEKLVFSKPKTRNSFEYRLFQFDDEAQLLKYSLLENRAGSVYYFDEFQNIDYILFIRGEIDSNIKETVLQMPKKNHGIISVLLISQNIIKKKNRLDLF